MTNDADRESTERFESIPWDALVTDDARRRRRTLTLAGGAIVVAVVAGIAVRWFGSQGAPELEAPPLETAAETPVTATTAVAVSEADLVSATPVGVEANASAHAAWFVADYFTADGSEITRRAVEERLPEGLSLPDPDPTVRSFVESAIPVEVAAIGPGRYRVLVVVRYLVAPDGIAYVRPEPKAAEVVVQVGDDGVAVVDLPVPADLPQLARAQLETGDVAEIPDHIAEAAILEAGEWGTPVGEPEAVTSGDAWRVTVVVEETSGLVLPVTVWLDESGSRLPPGGDPG